MCDKDTSDWPDRPAAPQVIPDRGAVSAIAHLKNVASSFGVRGVLEVGLVAVAFSLYFAVRSAVVGETDIAYRNAIDIIDLERSLGVFWEDDMNHWVSQRIVWAQLANATYFWLLFPLLIAFALWVYYFRRTKYTFIRDTFLASGAIGLVIFWLFPVAPPRELPTLAAQFDPGAPEYTTGFVDTVKIHMRYAHDSQSTGLWVNSYAAMPCLHVGWNLLMGVGMVIAVWRERWMWLAVPVAVALPVSQSLTVMVTANHYLLDILAGVAVALMAFPIAMAMQRWMYPKLGNLSKRIPMRTDQVMRGRQ